MFSFVDRNKNAIPRDSKCLSPAVGWWKNCFTEEETQDDILIQEMKAKFIEH